MKHLIFSNTNICFYYLFFNKIKCNPFFSLFKCLSTTKNWDNVMFKSFMKLKIKNCIAFIKVHSSF